MFVDFSKKFKQEVLNFPKFDKEIIFAFVQHVETNGLTNLKGRNKSSNDVPTDDPI